MGEMPAPLALVAANDGVTQLVAFYLLVPADIGFAFQLEAGNLKQHREEDAGFV